MLNIFYILSETIRLFRGRPYIAPTKSRFFYALRPPTAKNITFIPRTRNTRLRTVQSSMQSTGHNFTFEYKLLGSRYSRLQFLTAFFTVGNYDTCCIVTIYRKFWVLSETDAVISNQTNPL